MNIIYKVVILAFLFAIYVSCSNKNESKFYTINYQLRKNSLNEIIDTNIINHVLELKDDSIYFYWFENDFYDPDYKPVESFKIKNYEDYVVIQDSSELFDGLTLNFTDSTIFWIDTLFNGDRIETYGYEMIEFKCADRKDELIGIFKNSEVYIEEYKSKFEFNEYGFIISERDHFSLGLNDLWKLRTIKDELFLVIDGYPNNTLQVRDFSNERISYRYNGSIIKRINCDVIFRKVSKDTEINGDWIESSSLKYPVPFVKRSDTLYSLYKTITFTNDSFAITKNHYSVDTTRWIYNQFRDKIIFIDEWQMNRNIFRIRRKEDKQFELRRLEKDYRFDNNEIARVYKKRRDSNYSNRESSINLNDYESILLFLDDLEYTSGIDRGNNNYYYQSDSNGFYGFYNLFDNEFNYIAGIGVWVDGKVNEWKYNSSNQTVVSISTSNDKITFWNGFYVGMSKNDLVKRIRNYRELSNGGIVYFSNGTDVYEIEFVDEIVSKIEYSYLTDHSKFFKK